MTRQRWKTEKQRYEEKYVIHPNGCWQWRSAGPYPTFWTDGRYVKVARYAWQVKTGLPPPSDMCVCHTCDNPKCVNPDHLFLGTHTDNMRDKAAKQRTFRPNATLNGRAKVDHATAARIRADYEAGMTQEKIAAAYSIGQSSVSRIVRGENWT
jgi:hypothetical protein